MTSYVDKQVRARICVAWSCDEAIPLGSRADRIFCSTQCSRKVTAARRRFRERQSAGDPLTRTDMLLVDLGLEEPPPLYTPRPGVHSITENAHDKVTKKATPPEVLSRSTLTGFGDETFVTFANSRWPDDIRTRHETQVSAAEHFGVTQPTISGWMSMLNAAHRHEMTAEQWAANEQAQSLREYALSSFRNFTEVFFPDELIPDFHEEWDDELTSALDNAERTMLLAPQRHGKTSFMVRQCIYRIFKNPNIRIIIVGKTEDLAKKTVGVIRQLLENDPIFAEVMLPPDTGFRPPARRGLPWTNSELVVATRTKVLKSPTLVALGIGGTIIGRDADFIIVDDPVDRVSASSPSERTRVKEWFFTDFNSRIEETTAVAYIGSRQHKEDLPFEILKQNEQRAAIGLDPQWRVLIYRAHSLSCAVPLLEHTEDMTDCVLWPEFRSAHWLGQQQMNNPDHFQRNYQNKPTGNSFIPVTEKDIEAAYAYDEWMVMDPRSHFSTPDSLPRNLGDVPPKTMLLASVDPATAKPNAAVLWAYKTAPVSTPTDPLDPDSKIVPSHARFIVDFAEPRPGSPGVVDILTEWYEKYRVSRWVFETNYFADQIANDRDINDVRSRLGLRFETHYTGKHNKHDPRQGLLAMLNSMSARPGGIYLPGASARSKAALNRLVTMILNYDPESTHHASGLKKSGLDDDLLMAAWFGWYWMERQARQQVNTVTYEYGSGLGRYGGTQWDQPPWGDVA